MYQANCYVVSEGAEAFLVDPGDRADQVLDYLALKGLKLKFILLTHGHVDHVNGVDGIVKADPVPVYMHPKDKQAIAEHTPVFGTMTTETIPVADGSLIPFAGHEIRAIETPGHSKGGVCYYVDGSLFAGDTLFRHSIGRTDMFGGDYDELIQSIRTKLYKLPDETVVYSGHEDDTEIGHEKKYNSFIKGI